MAPGTPRGVVIQPPARGRYLPMGDSLYQQEEVSARGGALIGPEPVGPSDERMAS